MPITLMDQLATRRAPTHGPGPLPVGQPHRHQGSGRRRRRGLVRAAAGAGWGDLAAAPEPRSSLGDALRRRAEGAGEQLSSELGSPASATLSSGGGGGGSSAPSQIAQLASDAAESSAALDAAGEAGGAAERAGGTPQGLLQDLQGAFQGLGTRAARAAEEAPQAAAALGDGGASQEAARARELAGSLQQSLPKLQGSSYEDYVSRAAKAAAPLTDRAAAAREDFRLPSPEGVLQSVQGAADSLRSRLAEGASGLTYQLEDATSGARETLEDVTAKAADFAADFSGIASEAFAELQDQIDSVAPGVGNFLEDAAMATTAARTSLQDTVGGAVSTATAQIPEPVRDVVVTLARPLAQVLGQAWQQQPGLVLLLGTGAVVGPLLLRWVTTLGGYSGQLGPAQALEALKEQGNLLLLDLRPDEARQKDGVPDLRGRARGRALALDLGAVPPLRPSVARAVTSAAALRDQLNAVTACSLSKVGPGTGFIILGEGKGPVQLARAIQATCGQRAYVLQGGFKAWAGSGLPVKFGSGVDYGTTPLDSLADGASAVGSISLVAFLGTSQGVAVGVTALALSGFAAYDYHLFLRWLGVFSLELQLAWAVLRYPSPQAAYEDVSRAFKGVVGAGSRALGGAQSVTGGIARGAQSVASAAQQTTSKLAASRAPAPAPAPAPPQQRPPGGTQARGSVTPAPGPSSSSSSSSSRSAAPAAQRPAGSATAGTAGSSKAAAGTAGPKAGGTTGAAAGSAGPKAGSAGPGPAGPKASSAGAAAGQQQERSAARAASGAASGEGTQRVGPPSAGAKAAGGASAQAPSGTQQVKASGGAGKPLSSTAAAAPAAPSSSSSSGGASKPPAGAAAAAPAAPPSSSSSSRGGAAPAPAPSGKASSPSGGSAAPPASASGTAKAAAPSGSSSSPSGGPAPASKPAPAAKPASAQAPQASKNGTASAKKPPQSAEAGAKDTSKS